MPPFVEPRRSRSHLATTDPDTARDRWAQVHTEVQRIIEVAGQRLAESREAQRRPLARRTSLTPDERQVIADQVRHDILAQHDLEIVDPEAASPLAEIIVGLIQPENRPREEVLEGAQRLARRIELEDANRALRKGGKAIADTKLVLRKVMDGEGRPAPDKGGDVILPEIDRRLSENGVALESGRERQLAQLALQRNRLEAHQEVAERDVGRHIPTPGRPALLVPPTPDSPDEDPVPTLSEMLAIWRKQMNPKEKDWSDRALYINRFIQAYGDLRINEVRKKHIREFRNLHMDVPKAVPHRLRGASLND